MSKNNFSIYKIPAYNVEKANYEDCKFEGDIASILKRLEKNKGYHLKIDNTKPCKFYGDFDHCSDPKIFFEFLGKLNNILEITNENISYTESKNNDGEWSYHYVIPSIETTPSDVKYFFDTMHKETFQSYQKSKQLDTSVYNNILFRLPNQVNKNKLNAHIIKQGKMIDFVIEHVEDCEFEVLYPNKDKPKETPVIEHKVDQDINKAKQILDLLDTYDDYSDWVKCGMALKNSFGDEGKSLFIDWSSQYHAFKKDECLKKWDSFKIEGGLNFNSLIYWALECNKEAMKALLNEWKSQDKQSDYIKVKLLDKGSNDVALFISTKLRTKLVFCCDGKWRMFDKETCLWRKNKKPDAIIISHLQKEIDLARESLLRVKNKTDNDELKSKYSKLDNEYLQHYKQVTNGSYVSQLIKFLTTYLYDKDFINKLDNHKYKIVYQNGILDLKTLSFRYGLLQEDYLTKTIPFDYEEANEKDIKFVRTQLKKICNWNDEHLNYYLSTLGYAMTGDSSKEQEFYYLRGQTAENGKSIIFEVLEILMPNYVSKGISNILDKGTDLKKEIPTWYGLRILWLNELSTKLKDEDLVKATCDGTSTKFGRNYADEAEMIQIGFKLFCVSNNSLNIKGDRGIERRFKLLQFNSQFQDTNKEDDFEKLQFTKDKTFSEKLQNEYKHALLHLIFSYSKSYYEDKKIKPYPNDFKQEAKENVEDNNQFQTWFEDNFEIGKDFKISKSDLENSIPSTLKGITIKDELRRMKVPYSYDSQMRLKGKKGFFIGFQRVENDNSNPLDN